jgi:integrase
VTLDEAGLPVRLIADQGGHAQVSMTQDRYMGRKLVHGRAARALKTVSVSQVFSMEKPCTDLDEEVDQPA